MELYERNDEEAIEIVSKPSLALMRISIAHEHLVVNEYLVPDPNNTDKLILSEYGKNIIESLYNPPDSEESVVEIAKENGDKMFEEWWKLYPTTTGWVTDDKTKKFIGSRNLKNLRKSEAKKRYLKLLNQGLSHEDLIGSLKYEIKIKKVDSLKKNENQMEYFKGLESYLNQERYLLFIDEYRNNKDFTDEDSNIKKFKSVTDI